MAKSALGNTAQPICFLTEYEVEVDDDEYENMNGELVDEQNVFGYRAICPKNSDSSSVTIYFYYHAPTSEWYWDYNYGIAYSPIIPLVFTCDSNWKLNSCLNQNFYEIDLSNRSNGWISMNVTLTRKLVKNERIVFGVYSELLGISSSKDEWNTSENTNCYYYYSTARRRNYNSDIAYVSSSEFVQKSESIYSDWEVCTYLEYVNEIESVAYTRTVLGNVGARTSDTRKLNWKRTVPSVWNLNSSLNRKSVWKRKTNSNEHLSANAFRANHIFRAACDNKSFSDSSDKKLFFSRRVENQKGITANSYRSNRIRFNTSDGFSLFDSLQQLLLIIRSVFSSSEALDSSNHIADYMRLSESFVDDEESVIRWGESFRSFTDDVEFEARPFASRLFFRTVQTVMSFWDWLRGKIREANNVKSFYCPIWTEIEWECRI